MKVEAEKFSVISEIYTHFTEKNKKNLMRIAESLLKVQREDEEIVSGVTHVTTEKTSVNA